MDTVLFLYGKREIFPKVKEIERLRGGVAVYAAQASVRIDDEIGGKGRFRMKTSSERKPMLKVTEKPSAFAEREGVHV
ncbi:MAG: hypothetical protein K8R55_03075 [Desulfuromonadaceae bacterium]|nr:hypothetical protein [Desulfuromonadaceae bacterium]